MRLFEIGIAQDALGVKVAVAAEGEFGGGMGRLGLGEPGTGGGAVGTGVVQGGLGLAQSALVDVRVDAGEQLAGFHAVAFPDRQLDELSADFGGDLDLDLGLDAPGGDDRFDNPMAADGFHVGAGDSGPRPNTAASTMSSEDAATEQDEGAFAEFHGQRLKRRPRPE